MKILFFPLIILLFSPCSFCSREVQPDSLHPLKEEASNLQQDIGVWDFVNFVYTHLDGLSKQNEKILQHLKVLQEPREVNVDCSDLPEDSPSGVYKLHPNIFGAPTWTLCDQDTDQGNWTVILNRISHVDVASALNFDRSYHEYKIGFGDLHSDFWVGLENIYQWTRSRKYQLRIDLQNFEDMHTFALYNEFYIEDEKDGYRLRVSGYSGSAGDAFLDETKPHNGMKFTAKDRDQDTKPDGNCNDNYSSGWWFNHCYRGHLTGPFKLPGTGNKYDAIQWNVQENVEYFKTAKMMIRPIN